MVSLKNYHPIGDTVLVELTSAYKYVVTPDAKYDTKTSGSVVATGNPEYEYLLGKTVFFDAYKDSCAFDEDSKKFAFIIIEDIRGYKDEER